MTVPEAAAYLRVHDQTIRNLIHSGALRAARLGLNFRVERRDLDQMMTRRKRVVAPYRSGSKPWVARRHAKNRAKR